MPCSATVSSTSWSRKRLRMPIPKHRMSRRSRARAIAMPRVTRQLRGEGIADQSVGAIGLQGAAGGGHQRGIADMGNFVGFRLHGFIIAISYDQRMPQIRNSAWRVLPVLLLFVLYWPGLTTWFYQDDFGWLNLRHDVHSAGDLAGRAVRSQSARQHASAGRECLLAGSGLGIWGRASGIPHLHVSDTGGEPAVVGEIVHRLVGWAPAGFCAQILWLVNRGLAPAMGWSSIYNQVLSAFFFLLAFYFLLRHDRDRPARVRGGALGGVRAGFGRARNQCGLPGAGGALCCVPRAAPTLKRILPMFAVSAAAVRAHFYFAPPPHAGVYAPRIDSALGATFWTYWRWVLGPMPAAMAAALVAACVLALIVWGLRRRDNYRITRRRVVCDYRCCRTCRCPITGWTITWRCPRSASRCWAHSRSPECGKFRAGARESRSGSPFCVYTGSSLQASWTVTRWQHARGAEGGRPGARRGRSSPDGERERSFCWTGSIAISSGAAWRTCHSARCRFRQRVPCAGQRGAHSGGAGTALEVRAAAGDRAPGAGRPTRRGVPLRRQMLHNVTAQARRRWTEEHPRFVNIGDAVFARVSWAQAGGRPRERLPAHGRRRRRFASRLPEMRARACISESLRHAIPASRAGERRRGRGDAGAARQRSLRVSRGAAGRDVTAESKWKWRSRARVPSLLFGYAEVR